MSKKNKKLAKRLRKAASPTRALLLGALGGAAFAWLSRSRLQAGVDRLRARGAQAAHPAE